jgi:hypothetical protein
MRCSILDEAFVARLFYLVREDFNRNFPLNTGVYDFGFRIFTQ